MQYLLSFSISVVRGLFRYFWLITALLLIASAIGWAQYLAIHSFNNVAPNKFTIWDIMLLTIMLAPQKAPPVWGSDVPILLNVGRVFLPFVFLGGIFKVTLLRSATERVVNQWFARTFRGHAVVCGLSQAGFALVIEQLRRGRWVVLVDVKSAPSNLSLLQQSIATLPRSVQSRFAIVEGDGASTDTLKLAGVGHAVAVYAVTNDDFVNLDIATAARASVSTASGGKAGPKVHVHFKDYLTRDPLNEDFRLFDSRALAGRQMVNQYPADASWLATRNFERGPHAVVVGLGNLGEQVILQLARTAHYACGKRMTVTIIDKRANAVGGVLFERYPMLAPDATPDSLGLHNDEGNAMTLPLVAIHLVETSIDAFCQNGFAAACANHGIPGAVYICLGNDIETDRVSKAVSIALERATHLISTSDSPAPPCMVVKPMRRLSPMRRSADDLNGALRDTSLRVRAAEIDVLRAAAVAVITSDLELAAERTHNEYLAFSKERNIATADVRPWESLDEEARQMNYNTTDHHLVRLREMGINVCALDFVDGRLSVGAKPLADAKSYLGLHRESFADAEHRRWVSDKLFLGWRYTAGGRNIKAAKLNCSLVGYERLSEDAKQYDRDNVERAFNLVING